MTKYLDRLVVIHCNPSMIPLIEQLNYNWNYSKQFGSDEVDLFVQDIEYLDGNHPSKNGIWEDPDIQLCDHYGLDYDQVNMIELV